MTAIERKNIQIEAYLESLREEEKSVHTIKKYSRDLNKFLLHVNGKEITKDVVISYKNALTEAGYTPVSINSMLASVNHYLSYIGRDDCRVRSLKTQRKVYISAERELTRPEYERLLKAAEGKPRLHLLLQTICATGIRVSELSYFTVEAVRRGEINVYCKNKNRVILIPGKLKKQLLKYAHINGIRSGVIFRTRSGRAMDRSNIWSEMKALCKAARVEPGKVFPHNLRKLFARAFYRVQKDIAKLADVLGHSSINTTRIYIKTTGAEHRRLIERLGLVV